MVVLREVGQIKLIAEQNGLVLQTQVGPWRQWQYAIHTPAGGTEFNPDHSVVLRLFMAEAAKETK